MRAYVHTCICLCMHNETFHDTDIGERVANVWLIRLQFVATIESRERWAIAAIEYLKEANAAIYPKARHKFHALPPPGR